MTHSKSLKRALVLMVLCMGCSTITSTRDQTPEEPSEPDARAPETAMLARFIERHCSLCHGDSLQEAGLNLVAHAAEPIVLDNEPTWERVLDMLSRGAMPPTERPRPNPRELERVLVSIDAELDRVALNVKPDPGRVTARRLNRVEYRNTVFDLLGVDFDTTKIFPADDTGYGFDTIGDVLSISPLLMEKYFAAAETIADQAIDLEPSDNEKTSNLYERVFRCGHEIGAHTPACARTNLAPLARQAYRRPPTRKELKGLTGFVHMVEDDGGSFEEGMRLAMQAVLVSPQFLFRIERDRLPNDPATHHAVNDYELASRLSFFLWSSMPDETLLQLADEGRLSNPDTLHPQVTRMLNDEKSARLIENFAGQWLELRNLPQAYRDREVFPEWKGDLRRAMGEESRLFFDAIMREDRSLLEFIDADYTFVNELLAEHYGIEGVEGKDFQRVTTNGQRGGVLTQGSLLALTAHATRTSPVLRGKWILENILGTPPPPPPPEVPSLDDNRKKIEGTLRERMELHRSDATCKSCHARMDPLGFAMENYDAIGRWRTTEGDAPIDASATLPTGESFNGPSELRDLLLERKDDFVGTFSEKMLTYALGRGLERYDRPAVEQIAQAVVDDEYRFSRLIIAIVDSMPFQMRRGDPGDEA